MFQVNVPIYIQKMKWHILTKVANVMQNVSENDGNTSRIETQRGILNGRKYIEK